MRIQPVQQFNYNKPSVKKNSNVTFSGAMLEAAMKEARRPNNLKDWVQLFAKFEDAAKRDKGFVGTEYFERIENCMAKPSVNSICEEIENLRKKHFFVNGEWYKGREPIGKDSTGTSVLLCKDDDYAGFIRFATEGKVMDFGITYPINGKVYQFYREPYLELEYHPEQSGGNIRKASDINNTKYFNPDGSRDYGRAFRDLFNF